ncbi:MAG: hypothetical protein E6Q70_20595 [Pseudomonas monteilii]|nr:MAG: hypothetical protein E6Q70_20595 [Pseudomonas monteilii]
MLILQLTSLAPSPASQLPQYPTVFKPCGVPVGAGLPAMGPPLTNRCSTEANASLWCSATHTNRRVS